MVRKLRVEVTFLAAMQQVAGRGTAWLDLPPGATVARALALLRERMPELAGVDVSVSVNGVPAVSSQPLGPGDGLFLLPAG